MTETLRSDRRATEPPPQESLLVMLVRMEGKLDLTSQRLSDVVPRVERHEKDITALLLSVQGLADSAKSRDAANAAAWKARDDTVEATARALAEAKTTQEATATAETAKSDKSWAPATKLIAILGGVSVVIVILWAVLDRISAAIAAGP